MKNRYKKLKHNFSGCIRFYDSKTKLIYYPEALRFEKYSWFELTFRSWTKTNITSSEYYDHVPVCRCDDLLNQDLYYKKYNIPKEFEKYSSLTINHPKINVINMPDFDQSYIISKEETKKTYNIPIYYKKACLKCETCLDEYDKMIRKFDEIIENFDRTTNDELLNKICGG